MDSSLLTFMVVTLAILVMINIWLTLRLTLKVKYLRQPDDSKQRLQVGEKIPIFQAAYLDNALPFELLETNQSALVLIFLSSVCDKCRKKLVELEYARKLSSQIGVNLRLVTSESLSEFKPFLNSQTLLLSTLQVNEKVYDSLNPVGASPYYLFVDQQNEIQAEGFIGDLNWANFVEQVTNESVTFPQQNSSENIGAIIHE